MIHTVTILDEPLDVEFSYRIRERENLAEGIELKYDVDDIRLLDYNHTKLELPDWLRELVVEELLDSQDVYDKILEE